MLTVDDVLKAVADIDAARGDDEAAHSMEDDLHQRVLSAIAKGRCADPQACAAAALKTNEISFARWCA